MASPHLSLIIPSEGGAGMLMMCLGSVLHDSQTVSKLTTRSNSFLRQTQPGPGSEGLWRAGACKVDMIERDNGRNVGPPSHWRNSVWSKTNIVSITLATVFTLMTTRSNAILVSDLKPD